MPWLIFDKQNKITAKILRDDIISAYYDIISADYDVIIHWLKHLVYLNEYKVKPYKRVFVTLLTIF